MPAWLRQLVGLWLRSGATFVLLASALIAGAFVAGSGAARSLYQPSAQSEANSVLGGASVVANGFDWPSPLPGEELPDIVAPSTGLVTAWLADVSMKFDDATAVVDYREAPFPSVVSENRQELLTGSWPAEPGQCVSSTPAKSLTPTIGSWDLRLTGTTRELLPGAKSTLLCAPGTWQQWQVEPKLFALQQTTLQATVYASGPEAEALATFESLGWPEDSVGLDTRTGTTNSNLRSAQLITSVAPWLLIPLFAMIAAGVLVGRWLRAHTRILRSLGGDVATLRRTIMTLGLTLAGVVAASAGIGTSMLAKTLAPTIASTLALPGEVSVDLGVAAGTTLTAIVGAFLGMLLGQGQRRRTLARRATSTQGARRWHGWAALTCAGLWVLVTIVSGQDFWLLSVALLLLVLALGLGAVALTKIAARRCQELPPSPFLLAARMQQDSGKAGPVGTLGAVLALFVVVVAALSANGSVMAAMSAAVVPPGYALIGDKSLSMDPVPDEILTQFREDIGAHHPIRISESLSHPTEGYLWTFETYADAVAVLGELTAEQEDVLKGGGVLEQAFEPSGGQFSTMRSETVTLPVATYSGRRPNVFRVPGFAVAESLPPELQATPEDISWQLYGGLTPEQERKATSWKTDTGLTGIRIYTYREASLDVINAVTAATMLVLAVSVTLLVTHLLRGEAKQLRGIVAGLEAAGLPRSWSRQVLLYCAAWLTVIPAALALIGAVAAVLLLEMRLPTVFDPLGVPWWLLLGFVCLVLLGAAFGALSALRNVRHTERLAVVS